MRATAVISSDHSALNRFDCVVSEGIGLAGPYDAAIGAIPPIAPLGGFGFGAGLAGMNPWGMLGGFGLGLNPLFPPGLGGIGFGGLGGIGLGFGGLGVSPVGSMQFGGMFANPMGGVDAIGGSVDYGIKGQMPTKGSMPTKGDMPTKGLGTKGLVGSKGTLPVGQEQNAYAGQGIGLTEPVVGSAPIASDRLLATANPVGSLETEENDNDVESQEVDVDAQYSLISFFPKLLTQFSSVYSIDIGDAARMAVTTVAALTGAVTTVVAHTITTITAAAGTKDVLREEGRGYEALTTRPSSILILFPFSK